MIDGFLSQRFGFDVIYIPEVADGVEPVVVGDQQLGAHKGSRIGEETPGWNAGQAGGVIVALGPDGNVVGCCGMGRLCLLVNGHIELGDLPCQPVDD